METAPGGSEFFPGVTDMRNREQLARQALWDQKTFGQARSPLSNEPQLTRFRLVIEAVLMGLGVMAALATRHPAVTQPVRDAVLGGILALAGLYAVLVVWRGRSLTALRWVIVWCASLVTLYVASGFYSPTQTIGALRPAGQLILVIGWFLFVYGTDREKTSRLAPFVVLLAFLLMYGFLWIQAGFPHPYTGAMAHSAGLHKNILGPFAAVALFFMLAINPTRTAKVARTVGVILSLALLWASGSRGAQVAALVAAAVYVVWPIIGRHKWGYHAVFCCWLLAGTAFIYYYIGVSRSDSIMRAAVEDATGQPLYSGREILWPILLRYTAERPLLGWGVGVDEAEIFLNAGFGKEVAGAATMNAHNLYLTVLLKTGIVGLLLQLAILYSIWLHFYPGRHDRTVRLAAACFMGICVHELFETSLIHTNISIGLLFWAMIAIGMRKSDAAREAYASTAEVVSAERLTRSSVVST
jgi:O-antigen ligase